MPISIAIDGPAGAGKSTMADEIALRRGAMHLDTGAMYRAVALYMLESGVDADDPRAVAEAMAGLRIDVRHTADGQRVFANGEDCTDRLREPPVTAAASAVSKAPAVREAMVAKQREIALGSDIVMDGRDIGTCVLPNATVKIFLTAEPEARARRRWLEMQKKGIEADYETVLRDIVARDRADTTREVSPLKKADDAVMLDTTNLDIPQCVAAIERIVAERADGARGGKRTKA